MIENCVMSFWTRFRNSPKEIITKKDLYMWSLSFMQTRRFFLKTTFICDKMSEYIFIDKLKLPFDEIRIELDSFIEPELEWLWAVGKTYVYSIMREPFVHLDADIFINQSFDSRFLNRDILVQTPETFSLKNGGKVMAYDFDCYKKVFKNLPDFINNYMYDENQLSYNFGVFGGNDLNFIKKYTDLSFKVLRDNQESLNNVKDKIGIIYSIFLEQYIFSCLSQKCNYKVSSLYSFLSQGNQNNKYINTLEREFEHFAGACKHWPSIEKLIEDKLKLEYPNLFDRCNIISEELNLN